MVGAMGEKTKTRVKTRTADKKPRFFIKIDIANTLLSKN